MFTLLLCTILLSLSVAQPDGWKMTDRFYGFRYELVGGGSSSEEGNSLVSIQNEASTMGCFGWAQTVKESGSIVGEARCAKGRGKMFQDWLENTAASGKANFLVYSDTKIRLHFSHFKILEPERETCFLDPPHQCPEYSRDNDSTDSKTQSQQRSQRSNEL